MIFFGTRELTIPQKEQILYLWNSEYPEKLMHPGLPHFEKYLDELEDHSHIIMTDQNRVIQGWYFDFIREDRRWFAIIVNSVHQGKGYGTQLLKMAKEKETELNGWVVQGNKEKNSNGDYYVSPLNFYLKNGFRLISNKHFRIKNTTVLKIRWKK